jgi:hypothetical protein
MATGWTTLGKGGNGLVLKAQVHDCQLPAPDQPPTAVYTGDSVSRAIKVSLGGQYAWADAKGVPRVARQLQLEYEALLRTAQGDALHCLKPISMGVMPFAVQFESGVIPQEVVDLANSEEEDSIAAAMAGLEGMAEEPSCAEVNFGRPPGESRWSQATTKHSRLRVCIKLCKVVALKSTALSHGGIVT